jgi:tricorn protease interacting factor F2/3
MNSIRPIRYAVHLAPDLVNFRFSGRVELLLQCRNPVQQVKLNILDLAVWSCKVRMADGGIPCPFQVNPEKEELCIDLPEPMAGDVTLKIDYEGWISDKMAGFYRSTFKVDGEPRTIAVTQFQESDARRAFPCMDHPSQKAVFDIEMIIDSHLVALSNGPVVEEKVLPGKKKKVRFQTTPRMSTYLLFFGVGEFDVTAHETDPRVRSVTLPGMRAYGRFGLEFGQKALRFCEDYYRIPYALSKMDLIAVPDFAFGAMENWGAITFRENLILHFPHKTSKSNEMNICNVIAHEIVHQWFGNLVTPSDWKYLWLNESFATFFAYGVVNHYHPEWRVWDQFRLGQTDTALRRDSLTDTCAIEIPGGEHVVINTSTAPIIYSKGSSILRIIQEYIGPDDFKKGLRHYLKKFEYATAASRHLWEALEATSGKPVTALMKNWIEQPGHPLVQAQRDGQTLTLTQERFTYLENSFNQTWRIPITLAVYTESGTSRTISILMEKESTQVDLGADCIAYKVNAGQDGFYRVAYRTPGDLEAIGRRVASKTLAPDDRWGLQNDLFALVRKGDVTIDAYLTFIEHYADEDAYLPLSSIAENLFQAYLVLDGPRQASVRLTGRFLIEKTLSAIGYLPESDEAPFTSLLRDRILWHAVLYDSIRAADFTARQFKALMQGNAVHPDILKSVLMAGALSGGAEALDGLIRRFESSPSEHERIQVLTSLGCFQDPGLIHKALQYTLDKVPGRNRFVPITSAAANPHAAPNMWDWFVANVDSLEQLHPLLYERVIAGIVPKAGLINPDAVKTFFSRYIEQNPHIEAVARMSLERLEINLRMR